MAKETQFSKDLIKEFGAGAFVTGGDISPSEIIHVSPRIDLLLGGGIPGGSVVTMVGPPKCGKTLTALHVLGKAQQIGRPTFFLNVEGRIKQRDLDGIACLDKHKLEIARSYRDPKTNQTRILTAHEFLKIAEDTVNNVPGAVIVIDSISQLVTSGEMENELDKKDRAPGASLMAKFCRRLSNVIPVNDVVLIGILHFYANTSGYGKSKLVSGGTKIKYALDIGLECQKFEIFREGGTEDGRPIGQTVDWITTSTAFAPPGQKAQSIITYNTGIDELYEIVDMSIELGFVFKNGGWYTLAYMEDHLPEGEEWDDKQYKVQGKEKLINRIRDNEHERNLLINDFHAMMGVEQ
jgi:RecA/RadA recombinase